MEGRPAIERVLLALGIALVLLAPLLDVPVALALSVLALVIVLNAVHAASDLRRRAPPRGPRSGH